MSRGQKPRTPQHFPRMKYRARKRHRPHLVFTARFGGYLWAVRPAPIDGWISTRELLEGAL